MRACLAAIIMLASLSAPARAQPGADVSPIIPVHPAVRTIVQLPDKIERVQVRHGGEMMVKGIGSKLYVRPRWDTPAGVEALLEVKTRTLHRIIILQVVERAEDAMPVVVVPAPAAECREENRDATSMAPAPTEPSANASTCVPSPTLGPEPEPEPAPTKSDPAMPEPAAAAVTGRASAPRASRFTLSVHAVAALAGTTELTVPGYEPIDARQPHRAFGMRVAVTPAKKWWAVEANVSGESSAVPTTHERAANSIRVSGPWLRVDAGIRGRFQSRWTPTFYTGIGLQAHHRNIENRNAAASPRRTLPRGGVLALGLGFEYRAGDLLLGFELHLRQGVPDEYHSMAALLSWGFFLDQGE